MCVSAARLSRRRRTKITSRWNSRPRNTPSTIGSSCRESRKSIFFKEMLSEETPTVESLITQAGGCGHFQIRFVLVIFGSFWPLTWSGIFMAYGNYNPGWTCLDLVNNTITVPLNASSPLANLTTGNGTAPFDESCDAFERCQRVEFNSDTTTIVSEWQLLCSRAWIPSFMISLQMVGLLFGCFGGGHFGDRWGRKVTFYSALLLNGSLSLVAAFSVNWVMFAALKLLIGVPTGACISIIYALVSEFVPIRCRGILSTCPVWAVGCVIFSIMAMIVRDWKYLHIINCVVSVVFSMSAFWAPESMRWLATKNKLNRARSVAQKIANTNRKPLPNLVALEIISQTERCGQYENIVPKHSVSDIFKRSLIKRTLIMSFVWFNLVIVYYGIGFSVKALSGNFFLNLTLFPLITILPYPMIPPIANRIGRKVGIILFFILSTACCLSIVLVKFVAPPDVQGQCTTILALLVYSFVESSWSIVVLYTLELYPTVVRGVGYGFASGSARVGGIVAPYLIPNDQESMYISYIVLGTLMAVCSLLIPTLPETTRRPLQDNMLSTERQTKDVPANDSVELEENGYYSVKDDDNDKSY